MLNASLKDLLQQHCHLPEYFPLSHIWDSEYSHVRATKTWEYLHMCNPYIHICAYYLTHVNIFSHMRIDVDVIINILISQNQLKFFKVLISVPKLDRKAWIFPTFFFVNILKFSKKSHICEAQEPHMWLYSHMWVRTVSYTDIYSI